MRLKSGLAFSLFLLSPVQIASANWAPCGGISEKLWAWAWAGENNENVVTNSGSLEGQQYLDWMGDLSGNGHHYFNNDADTLSKKPKFEIGVDRSGDWGSYQTSYAPFDRNRWNNGDSSQGGWLDSNHTFSAPGEFYVVGVIGNIRNSGTRNMWGRSETNTLRLDQEKDRVRMRMGSTNNINLTDSGAVPRHAAIVLEIFRDSSNVVHVWANGEDIGLKPTAAGTFQSKGWGWWPGGGTSHWDDYAFELITCNGLPDAEMRAETREYLQKKWGLTGPDSPPPPPPESQPSRPNPPTGISVD